ncbi:DinB family protein [Thermocoleostomius sinensis]|uniref:DinB family protein n=1 Tax=Thermocoleostomius sinensis A174 TaxID=2016057 RepID=A0A9E8ZI43_9CYAN|nr:DinB family protein [Thermocoleostomius sinensis]WAL61703.1 DinB family protein [Thermocoleostomius sinensis A174]
MLETNYYEIMAAYNAWMNQKLYEICAKIPDEKRKEDLGAFFKSIHGTLNHLLVGDRIWMGRFTQQPVPYTIKQELYSDFDELRHQRQLTDQTITNWTKSLSPAWLAQPFTYTSNLDKKPRTLPTWLLVTHLFNHQIHHRGQLTTLLNQLGYDSGVTDLPWLPTLHAIFEETATVE